MVGARGFEPPTSCSQSKHSTRLSYAPEDANCSAYSCRLPGPCPERDKKPFNRPRTRRAANGRWHTGIPIEPEQETTVSDLAFDAMVFARQVHSQQVRKYTGNPYADHLAEVAGIVATC